MASLSALTVIDGMENGRLVQISLQDQWRNKIKMALMLSTFLGLLIATAVVLYHTQKIELQTIALQSASVRVQQILNQSPARSLQALSVNLKNFSSLRAIDRWQLDNLLFLERLSAPSLRLQKIQTGGRAGENPVPLERVNFSGTKMETVEFVRAMQISGLVQNKDDWKNWLQGMHCSALQSLQLQNFAYNHEQRAFEFTVEIS